MGYALVTIIIPFRNQGLLLRQACRSVQIQSEVNWRAILINDASRLDSVAVAEDICKLDQRFRLIHVKDTDRCFPGPWRARNLGLHFATTRLVAFLDADDLWHPKKLEKQLYLHQESENLISVCNYYRFNDSDLSIHEIRKPSSLINKRILLSGNNIPLSSVIADRNILLAAGGFKPEKHEDYGLWLRLFLRKDIPQYVCVNQPLMAYRIHGQSISSARYRSIIAVNSLFKQHFPKRDKRSLLLFRWLLNRLLVYAHWKTWRLSNSKVKLPEPFLSLATEGDNESRCQGMTD